MSTEDNTDNGMNATLKGYATCGNNQYPTIETLAKAAEMTKALSQVVELTEKTDLTFLTVSSPDALTPAIRLGSDPHPIYPTRWVWSQIAGWLRVPLRVLDRLHPNLVSTVLQDLWDRLPDWSPRQLLLQHGGPPGRLVALKAMLSTVYSRVWDADVLRVLSRELEAGIWEPAYPGPARHPDRKAPACLWRDDEGMLVVLKGSPIPGTEDLGAVCPALMVENSEVGKASLAVWHCLYTGYCGNFHLLGLEQVQLQRYKHTSQHTLSRFREALRETKCVDAQRIRRYAETPLPLRPGWDEREGQLILPKEFHAQHIDGREVRREQIAWTLMQWLATTVEVPTVLEAMEHPWNRPPAVEWGSTWHVVQSVASLRGEDGDTQAHLARAAGQILAWAKKITNGKEKNA